MTLTRRGLLASTAGALACPAIAAGTRLQVWWNQGFYPAEDAALRALVAAWEQRPGHAVALSLYSTSDIPTKIISAITVGAVPDLCYADQADFTMTPQQSWRGNLVDVSDVVTPQEAKFSRAALQSVLLYNRAEQRRAYYAVPLKQQALHNFYWRPMIEQAGYQPTDVPKTWGEYWAFFQEVQKRLRAKGKRVYGLGFSIASKDTDSLYLFNQLWLAYGGVPVGEDGRLRLREPAARKAAVDTLGFLHGAYRAGSIPPGAINWGDPDNNAAFYARQIVSTPNASLSIPVAKKDDDQLYRHDIVTNALPLGPSGQPVPSLVAVKCAFIPKGATNVDAAKDFLRSATDPATLNAYLVAAQGRWFPVMPDLARMDPFWTNGSDPHIPVAARQEMDGPTQAWWQELNPAYADVNAQQVWGRATADVLTGGVTPDKAVETAFAQIEAIFSNYPMAPG